MKATAISPWVESGVEAFKIRKLSAFGAGPIDKIARITLRPKKRILALGLKQGF